MKRLVPALLILLALAGCSTTQPAPQPEQPSSSPSTSATPTVEPTPEAAPRADVPWADYAPDLQSRIDALATAADCTALQTEFDTADTNSDATLARTGHSNADLLTYIDEALKMADCY